MVCKPYIHIPAHPRSPEELRKCAENAKRASFDDFITRLDDKARRTAVYTKKRKCGVLVGKDIDVDMLKDMYDGLGYETAIQKHWWGTYFLIKW